MWFAGPENLQDLGEQRGGKKHLVVIKRECAKLNVL